MIDKYTLMKKLGKKGFTDFVIKNRDKEKTFAERERGIKGRVRFRQCKHRVWVIDNYLPKFCGECLDVEANHPAVIVHSHEYFNCGTGTYGTTTEHRKYAKAKGLEERG